MLTDNGKNFSHWVFREQRPSMPCPNQSRASLFPRCFFAGTIEQTFTTSLSCPGPGQMSWRKVQPSFRAVRTPDYLPLRTYLPIVRWSAEQLQVQPSRHWRAVEPPAFRRFISWRQTNRTPHVIGQKYLRGRWYWHNDGPKLKSCRH